MRFLSPDVLWLLVTIPALVAVYVIALRRKRRAAVRYASLMLLREALGPRLGPRRHLPPLLFLLAMTTAILASARPTATVVLPSEHMTIILAMDVSGSMRSRDVQPSRIAAAETAARAFIQRLPGNVRVGIVSFAATASAVQTITDNHEDLLVAIDRFVLQRGTATGSGLLLSLAQLFPDAGIDLESSVFDSGFSRFGGGVSIDRSRKAGRIERKDFKPVPPGSYTSGAIILLSDGRRTTGPDPIEAAKMAADRGVRIFTVGLGTKDGGISGSGFGSGFRGQSFFMQPDEETLKAVADITGGEFFHAGTAVDLQKVYQSLHSKIGLERQDTEVGALFSAATALLVIFSALLSMLWFHRRS